MMEEFKEAQLKKLFKPQEKSTNEDNGQVTIIGGSRLFHGAPILALKTASRIVDMVFFSSPEPSISKVAEQIKGGLGAFIWVPFEEIDDYVVKSDAILIGPGFMRYHSESKRVKEQESKGVYDEAGNQSKKITEKLLRQFPNKQWVIDAGSLQVMETKFIPENAILTPNKKEFRMLFSGEDTSDEVIKRLAKKYHCIIVLKGPQTIVCSSQECVLIGGGNAGLTKGGTGDVLAGLTVALAAKNPPFFAACAASFIVKKAADELYKKVGLAYNADDLAEKIPEVLGEYWR